MRLDDLKKVQVLRDMFKCAMKAFEEAAEFPHCRFPLWTHFSSGGVIAALRGSDVLPILGRHAAEIVVELTDLGIDMTADISPHLSPYIIAIRHPKQEVTQ